LRYEETRGSRVLIEKMIHGPWDHEFIVAPPGHTIRLQDFGIFEATEQQPADLSREETE
jgi:hypothetical protein